MLKVKDARLIQPLNFLNPILPLLVIVIFPAIFLSAFPVKTGEAAEIRDAAAGDYDVYISRPRYALQCCLGHTGGTTVGDVNGDGTNDLIVSSIAEKIVRDEYYLPWDRDEWTKEDALSMWSVVNGTPPVASPDSIAGGTSISTTRTAAGSLSMKLKFTKAISLDPAADALHLQIYAGDSNERLAAIIILAPDWNNRFEYAYTDAYNPGLQLNDAGWTPIDLPLSDFVPISSTDQNPDWNNVTEVVISFLNEVSSTGEIRIDQLYFDHFTSKVFIPAGAVYMFYGGLKGGTLSVYDDADVTIKGVDAIPVIDSKTGELIYKRDLTGEYIATGDLNNDGYADIIIGTTKDDGPDNEREDCGAVSVIFGSNSLPSVIDLKRDRADFIVYGADAGDNLGISVIASDINADGYADLIAAASGGDGVDNEGDLNGEIHIVLGSPQFQDVLDLSTTRADISIYGGKPYDKLGTQGSLGTGDIFNDGQVDLIIGVWGGEKDPDRRNAGEIVIINNISDYKGKTIDLASLPSDAAVIYGAEEGDRLSRLAIGDVNSDGIDDIIASAAYADGPDNLRNEAGEVYIFFGSPSFPREIDLNTTAPDVRITGADAGDYIEGYHNFKDHKDIPDHLGLRVYAADINNDGMDDVLMIALGGDGEDNLKLDAGDAYVFFGRSSWPATIDLKTDLPDITVYGADKDDGLRDIFGGDINADGIDDLIIGYRWGDGPEPGYPYAGDIIAFYGGFGSPGNYRPEAPQLVSPEDGATGLDTTVEFVWKKSTDPDGDPVTYSLHVCEDGGFTTGCISRENISSTGNRGIYYAGGGSGLLLFGMIFAGGALKGKRRTALLLVIIMISASVLVSCGSGGGGHGGGNPDNSDQLTQTVSGLKAGTTYYWKVVADDGRGAATASSVRNFTTR
ncbi:MAG: hypothetical protein GXP46_03230 [Deferribacteres bacterium]|nr:hypothetical protein [Deferribacteres bacterium]